MSNQTLLSFIHENYDHITSPYVVVYLLITALSSFMGVYGNFLVLEFQGFLVCNICNIT